MASDKTYLKLKEAAELLNVSVQTLKHWIDNGKIKGIKTPGGHHRIARSEIEKNILGIQDTEVELDRNSGVSEDQKPQVLIIEDNFDTRALLEFTMKNHLGYEPTMAKNSEEALSLWQNQSFDLYLLDNRLPDGTGIDLCRRIRELYPRTPIIMYSAIHEAETVKKAREAGVTDYLLKPDDQSMLEPVIRQRLTDYLRVKANFPS